MPATFRPLRPVRHHNAKDVHCPNPLCDVRLSTRKMLHGIEIDSCVKCGQDYLVWGAFGAADITGLSPEEAKRFADGHVRLEVMLSEIGVHPPAHARAG